MKFKRNMSDEKKAVLLGILIAVLGNIAGFVIFMFETADGAHKSVEFLERREYGQGGYEEELIVQTEEGKERVSIYVKEKEYTEEEADRLLETAAKGLEALILGENRSLEEVRYPLNLPEQYPDSPVQIYWSTEMPGILDWQGNIGADASEEGSRIKVRCQLCLGEKTREWMREVVVFPEDLRGNQALQKAIQRAAEELNKPYENRLLLPEIIKNQRVKYQKKEEKNSIWICLLGTVTGVMILPVYRERKKQKEEARRLQMQNDYPDIISKLLLFIQAGLTVRIGIEKIVKDYQKGRREYGESVRFAYEELAVTCREIQGGVPELQAYERLGSRCRTAEYKVLSVLLVQNLRKGNHSVQVFLEREAAAAIEERKRNSKIRGEQVSARLLAPMFLQLVIVLIILMIPAFMNFYI